MTLIIDPETVKAQLRNLALLVALSMTVSALVKVNAAR